jgi:starch synthase
LLVDYNPADTATFEHQLAEAVNKLVEDPGRAEAMGKAGRARAVDHFAWPAIAAETVALYEDCLRQ